MVNKPVISIIIATFNSERILPLVLKSIKKQTFKGGLEVLVIDGGSTDKTLKIASDYGARVINNPRTEPVFAKFLGYRNANGKYIMYLDHDEVIENIEALDIKYSAFKKNDKVRAVIGSGYKNPEGISFINNYINEFGDPFSFFIYRLSKDYRFFLTQMKSRYKVVLENEEYVIFDLSEAKNLPIIELCAAGSLIDAYFMKRNFPKTLIKPSLIPHFFYLINTKSPFIAITKNDALLHYSSESLRKYLNKIRWRVKNNIYYKSDMGESGFTGRNKYQTSWFRYKNYLYLPYAFTFLFPLIDAISLSLSRRNIGYLMHFPLTIFTASLIVYHYFLKLLGAKPKLRSYDESKEIVLQ